MKSIRCDYFSFEKKRKSLTPCLKVLKQHIQLLRQKGPKNIIINYKLCNSSFGIRSQSTNSYTSVDNILVHIWIYICPHSTSVWSCSVKWRWWSNSNAEWHLVALGIRGHGMAGSWPSVHRYCIWWNSNPFQFGSSLSRTDCSQQTLSDLFWVRALACQRTLSLKDEWWAVSRRWYLGILVIMCRVIFL